MRRSPKDTSRSSRQEEPRWSFFTAHALVLLCIARNPDTRVREIAEDVGISERGAHQIVSDLVGAGYVRRARIGRRNRYAIEEKAALRRGPLRHRRVASIIALLGPEPARSSVSSSARPARDARRTASASTAKSTKRRAA